MRLRICRQPAGSIHGIRVDHFRAGFVYEVGAELADVFLAEGWAEPVVEDGAAAPVRQPPNRIAALVLVVDDEPDLRQLTIDLLTCNGYEVVEARHGREALARLREHFPDLVILDLNMPVMDGWQFRTEQQRLPDRRLAAIPVLLLTGAGDVGHATAMKAVGMIQKPFHPEQLLRTVETALRG